LRDNMQKSIILLLVVLVLDSSTLAMTIKH
jgi:hypothetical protein